MKKLTVIACIDSAGLLGVNNKIPWNIPEDMAHFKEYTLGKSVIMGANTFYSLPAPLENRVNIVISQNEKRFDEYINKLSYDAMMTGKEIPVICFANSVEDFFQADLSSFGTEMVCIGGGKMYETLLPYATDMIITRLYNKFPVPEELKETAVYFPSIDKEEWTLSEEKELHDSLGVSIGKIMYFKSNASYSNVVSFNTEQELEVEEIFCALNFIGSVFDRNAPIIYDDEVA